MASETASGYWYDDETKTRRGVRVLNAMREYRAAEAAMRKRTRESMRMGETDVVALRLLLQAKAAGRSLSPKDLSAKLGISSASTTILVDRLQKSGHVAREPHPSDRRGIVIVPTADTDVEVRATLDSMHTRMIEVAEGLSDTDADAIEHFLTAMRRAVESAE